MFPRRGFPRSEFQARTIAAQTLMDANEIGALLLTTAPDIYYFTGYLTRFWESPSRPWFLVVPSSGTPIAVIPTIGENLMSQTWVEDIRTWPSPRPEDEGISLLAETLNEVTADGSKIGVPSGPETHLRLPLSDFKKLSVSMGRRTLSDDARIVQQLRMIKSPAEIEKIKTACDIAGRAFARVPQAAPIGTSLSLIFRRFQTLCLDEGADWVPYLAGAGEKGGYSDVISPAHDRQMEIGDILMLDTGLVWDGYFCDFDRNWSYGAAGLPVSEAHRKLVEAFNAGLDVIRPGITASDVYHAMARVVGDTNAGRLGHGLGLALTEWPSLIPSDQTVLQIGMVLTLEPGIEVGGKMLVHEENLVVTVTGAEVLSPQIGPDLLVIS